MAKKIVSEELLTAVDRLLGIGSRNLVRRVVIDIRAGDAPVVHVERFVDDEDLVEVVTALSSVEVRYAAQPTAAPAPGPCPVRGVGYGWGGQSAAAILCELRAGHAGDHEGDIPSGGRARWVDPAVPDVAIAGNLRAAAGDGA